MSVYGRMRVRGGGISSGRGAASVGARARSVGGVMSEARARVKHAVMERVGYVEVARIVRAGSAAQARMELRPALEAALNADVSLGLGFDERNALIADVLDDMTGLGPLQALLEDDSVTEIMVNARLPNGFRVNAVIPPIAIDGPTMTIRKFSDRISTLAHLVDLGSIPDWYAHLLGYAVRCRMDLAVAGGTGSGKTTLLNALSCEISQAERIVTIEDSAELKFSRHPHVVRLEAREASIEGAGEVAIHDLVVNALRMRPDRIVVGEVRNREAIDMLEAMSTGHDGSLTTLHAGSAQEAIVRLTLLARYGIDLQSELIEEQIAMALDGVVMSVRKPGGRRFVSSFTGVSRAEGGGVALTEYVSFDPAKEAWTLIDEPPFIEEAVRSGLLDEGEVREWRSSCRSASAC